MKLLSSQPLLDLHNQIEHLRVDLNKLQGQIEVLGNESELTQKRQKDFYIDLDDRLRRMEQHGETMGSHSSAPAPKEKEPDMRSSVDADSAPDTDAETTAMASAAAPGVSLPLQFRMEAPRQLTAARSRRMRQPTPCSSRPNTRMLFLISTSSSKVTRPQVICRVPNTGSVTRISRCATLKTQLPLRRNC